MLTQEDVTEHQARLSKDKDFHPDFSQLADFLQVTRIELTSEDVRTLAQTSQFSPHSRRAFLVKDDLTFGLARMFQLLREVKGETGVRVFRKLDDALEWLLAKNAAR